MMSSLTDVTFVSATFVKLRGSVFNVTKHVARDMPCCPALIITLFDNLALTLH
jgi:hypothetical protein